MGTDDMTHGQSISSKVPHTLTGTAYSLYRVKFHKMYHFEKVKILDWKVKIVKILHKEVCRKVQFSHKV